jgi:hypothetical protein
MPLLDRMTARRALTLADPIQLGLKMGALLCSVIGYPPRPGFCPLVSIRTLRRIFRARKTSERAEPDIPAVLGCIALQQASSSRSHPPMSVW